MVSRFTVAVAAGARAGTWLFSSDSPLNGICSRKAAVHTVDVVIFDTVTGASAVGGKNSTSEDNTTQSVSSPSGGTSDCGTTPSGPATRLPTTGSPTMKFRG